MTEAALKFSRAEYADRLRKTRQAMEEKGVDLLIVTDPSNMNWLTGYDASGLAETLEDKRDFEAFFAKAPRLNPDRELITGVVCGVRVEEIDDELMRRIRQMDKIVDELARGKKIESITRMPRNDPA